MFTGVMVLEVSNLRKSMVSLIAITLLNPGFLTAKYKLANIADHEKISKS